MKYRKFADLDWNISEVGLGCWQLGWSWGEKLSDEIVQNILKKCLDEGVNFFDTSDTYGNGRSEKFLSHIVKSSISNSQKEQIYITTKLGRRHRDTKYTKNLYPLGVYTLNAMEEFVDRSLSNLRLDKIDLLQLHCPPIDVIKNPETYEVLKTLVNKGKILHYGVSVYYLSEAYEAMKIPYIKSIQVQFSMIRQKPNENLFDLAKKNNIAIIARGPLASGLLSGEINKHTKFGEDDHRNFNIDGSKHNLSETFAGVNFDVGLEFVEELKKILPKNFTLSELALKWILMHDQVTTVIPGALTHMQAEINSRASSKPNIAHLLPDIRAIYEKLIKKDNHDLWD